MEFKKVALEILDKLEILPKIVGVFAAILAICAVLMPSFLWKPFEAMVASVYGVSGYVYYEVGVNRKITSDGNFYLLKVTKTGYYDEIAVGDKLRVAGDVNFRSGPGREFSRSFVLFNGDCVVVTSTPKKEVKVEKAKSGGWLNVATSPCGLF